MHSPVLLISINMSSDCCVIFNSLDNYTCPLLFIADDRLFDQISRGPGDEGKDICACSHAMIALGYRVPVRTAIQIC